MSLTSGYSEYWRKNSSPVEKWELVFLLKSLKKAALYVTDRVKSVEWKGISFSEEKEKILLDPSFVIGQYPVPPGKVDALVGWVVHEAFHLREMSDLVLYKAEEYAKEFSIAEKTALLELAAAGEDIYVNNAARETIWKFYLERMWKWYYPRVKKDYGLPLTWLFDLWRSSFFKQKFTLPPEFVPFEEPLNLLIEYGGRLLETAEEDSPSQRAIDRFNVYQELWSLFYPFVKDWGADLSFSLSHYDITREDASTPRKIDIEELREILAREEDLTSRIRLIAVDKPSVIPTFWGKEKIPCSVLPDLGVVRKLRFIFESQKQKNKVVLRSVNRGLLFGKIDGRRLHRVFIDGKLFKRREYNQDQYWNVTILVDASRSMAIDKREVSNDNWYNVQKTFCSLYEAAKGYKNKINLFAYYEQAGRCYVSSLLQGNRLYTTFPRGRTPSGQAIMAVALNMNYDRGKKDLLIHITDGESNCGIDVAEAVEYCEKRKINLVTIGCGYNEKIKDYFLTNYKNIYLMDNFEELPVALEVLLKRTLLT
jgi:hypothetical protein